MSQAGTAAARKEVLDTAVDVAIRLAVIGLIAVWCFGIFRPFILPMIWGIIIAVAAAPLFAKLTALVGGRRGWAATAFTLAAIVLIIIPTFRIADSVVHSSLELAQQMEAETLRVPPPNPSVQDWPLVGNRTYEAWNLAATNLDAAVARFTPQIKAAGGWLLVKVSGLAGAILHTIIALIIAGFMLTYAASGEQAATSVLGRLGGPRGAGMAKLTAATISSVFKGVLGVAIVQAALAGIGLFLAGVPGWGVWTVLVLVLAVIQLPPILVLLPIIFYVFSASDSTVVSVVFAVYAIVVSASDTFLKPLFLGRGLAIPMPVILIGAIGGMIKYGIIGLFVGAVVLAIGYELFMVWVNEESAEEADAGPAEAPAPAG